MTTGKPTHPEKIFGVKSLFMLFERETKGDGRCCTEGGCVKNAQFTKEDPSFHSPESWASGGRSGFAYQLEVQ